MYRFLRSGIQLALVAVMIAVAGGANAWKPIMHVYLAEQALAEIRLGKVPIYRVNYQTGAIGAKIGDYAVDPEILQAVQSYPQYYRAGVLGPDAYPDILTGQMAIHPDGTPGSGSNAWLEYIWARSQDPRYTGADRLKIRAWATGFLTHAAGDMYGHTFINNFAGGDWELGLNAVKHVLCEGYVAKRIPNVASFDVSIAGPVDKFIYENLCRADPHSELNERLLTGDGASYSIPHIFSVLRANLKKDIDYYYASSKFEQIAYSATHPFFITYKEHWVDDIDSGLKAWPGVSHEVAKALFFNPGGINTDMAHDILNNYVNQHLLSMAGAPDFVGLARGVIQNIIDAITPQALIDLIKQIKKDILNYILKSAFGFTVDDLKNYVKSPETYFNKFFAPGSPGPGDKVTLATFNSRELHVADAGFQNPNLKLDWHTFPAAYNTVTMTKLLFLSQSEMNRLLADLRSSARMTKSNAMLGFDHKLDGNNQWARHTDRMILVHGGVYDQVFMKEAGSITLPPGSNPTPPDLPVTVTVVIKRVVARSNLDPWSQADFYPKVDIAGERFTKTFILDKDDISPNWTFSKQVMTSARYVKIHIEIWDSDGGLFGADDPADINPANGRFLDLTYDLQTRRISGSVSGAAGAVLNSRGHESDSAEIWFTVSH